MRTISYNEKQVDICLNMYALRKFGQKVDANTPDEAFAKLQTITQITGGKVTFEAQDIIASLFMAMHETACEIKRQDVVVIEAEAHDVLLNTDAFTGMFEEVTAFLPEPETVKKNKVTAKKEEVAEA